MNQLSPLHLSHSARHGDGGIAFSVSDLLHAQQELGLYSRWLTADRYSPINRDHKLFTAVCSLKPDLIHCHGLWRSHTRISAQFMQQGVPYVIAPHGMLDPWAIAHSSWKKDFAWQLWEERSLRSASCLHALCSAEARSIRSKVTDVPIAVIPNGVEILEPIPNTTNLLHMLPWHGDIPQTDKILLFLGRYHLKKGLEPLMSAWQTVVAQAKKHGWWLVFIGFGDDDKFISQINTFPVERCRAYGPVFGFTKQLVYQKSHAFVLPSYSEGLPIAALEAMANSLPCLLSSACNLPEAFMAGAAIESNPESSSLISALECLFMMSEESLSCMGSAGNALVKACFSWQKVAKLTSDLYRWIQDPSRVTPNFLWNTASN